MNTKKVLLMCATFLLALTLSAQCPTESCTDHSTITSTATLPECGTGTLELQGNIDNNSDCDGPGNTNCWKYTFTQHDPTIPSLTFDIGKGNGCNGEVDNFYTDIDGVCVDHGSSGSQNSFTFSFGATGTIVIWLCDGSSGTVSICDLCADEPAPLPVELTFFKGKTTTRTNVLSWATANEENVASFVVEKSLNGKDFNQEVGFLEATGFSTTPRFYQLEDKTPQALTYYRLRSIDFDGSQQLSDIVSIERKGDLREELMTVSPVPFKQGQTLQITYEAETDENVILMVSDIAGRQLFSERMQLEEGVYNWTIDLKEFNQNLLITQLRGKNGTQTKLIPVINLD